MSSACSAFRATAARRGLSFLAKTSWYSSASAVETHGRKYLAVQASTTIELGPIGVRPSKRTLVSMTARTGASPTPRIIACRDPAPLHRSHLPGTGRGSSPGFFRRIVMLAVVRQVTEQVTGVSGEPRARSRPRRAPSARRGDRRLRRARTACSQRLQSTPPCRSGRWETSSVRRSRVTA